MSKPNVSIICEGYSDYLILNEIICDRLCLKKDCNLLQPPLSRHMPGGWGFIWKFCKEKIGTLGLNDYLNGAGTPIDILVVAIDGDCSREGTLYCHNYGKSPTQVDDMCINAENAYSCYFKRISTEFTRCNYFNNDHPIIDDSDISARVEFLNKTVKSWLLIDTDVFPDFLVITVPVDAIENWLVCAVEGGKIGGQDVENCNEIFRNHILLKADYYNIDASRDSSALKIELAREHAATISKRWGTVIKSCSQARLFSDRLFYCSTRFESHKRA